MSLRYDDLSREELIRLLDARDRRDATRFGLVWEANEIERERALNGDFVALDLDKTLSCGEAPFQNLIIEGDNFDALRHLRMCYAGKVKCIYIDPPYNTGNKDFVYNDRFVDKEDGWRHSKWCEFMFQRLTLAKDLLTQDGVIFVSIDGTEIYSLGLLMNKVFGLDKNIGTLIWKTRKSVDSRNISGLSADHEYILVFGNVDARFRGAKKDTEKYSNPDNDIRGPWMSDNLVGLATKSQRPNLHYELIHPQTGIHYPCPEKGWRYSQETMRVKIEEGRILWPSKPSGRPRHKKFFFDLQSEFTGFSSILDAPTTQDGTREVNNFGVGHLFSFPKPSELIRILLEQATNPGDLILDFFAGSGTTAHAVLKLNAEDGGKRRFILVSSTEATEEEPDKNLCRAVCAERVRRVIRGYAEHPPLGGDFAYLRCRRIPAGDLIEIEHEQVWTALQMIHCRGIAPFEQGDFLLSEEDDFALVYVARFSKKMVSALRKAVEEVASVIVYSWQPEALRQALRLGSVQHEAIPESLARRFGIR